MKTRVSCHCLGGVSFCVCNIKVEEDAFNLAFCVSIYFLCWSHVHGVNLLLLVMIKRLTLKKITLKTQHW